MKNVESFNNYKGLVFQRRYSEGRGQGVFCDFSGSWMPELR